MKKLIRLLLVIAISISFNSVANCDPTVEVLPIPKDDGKEILFSITQPVISEMEGCHYNLFAADKASDLESLPGKGLSIATFYRASEQFYIIAVELKRLSRSKLGPQATVYFRMLMSCPERPASYLADTTSLTIETSPRGRVYSVDRLIKRMKYHMRWATDSDLE